VRVTYSKPNEASFGSYVWSDSGGKVDLGSLGGGYSHAFVIRADGTTEYHVDLSRISYIDADGRIYGLDHSGLGVTVENGVTTSIASLTGGAAGWQISPHAVNEAGQIMAFTRHDNKSQLALLSPAPEPATYTMLCVSLGLICLARRAYPGRCGARP